MKKLKNKILQFINYILGLFQVVLIYLLFHNYISIIMFMVLSISTETIIFILICYGIKSLYECIINWFKKAYLYIRVKDKQLRDYLLIKFGLKEQINEKINENNKT